MREAPGTRRLAGRILTPDGFVDGVLSMQDGRIVSVSGEPVAAGRAQDTDAPILLPGFIDLHVHGGAGADVMQGGDAVRRIARCHVRHGTTALLATTMTAPTEDLELALRALAPHVAQRPAGGARSRAGHRACRG